MFYSCAKSISTKNPDTSHREIFVLVLPRNAMLQHLIIQFPPYDLSSGRLREVINKRKFQIFSSRSGRGRLREVVAYKRFQIQ